MGQQDVPAAGMVDIPDVVALNGAVSGVHHVAVAKEHGRMIGDPTGESPP